MTTSTSADKSKANEPSAVETWITRTTAILAVVAAISSGRWGACNLQAILEQGKVNDTWSYYQAKSMKQHEAEQTQRLAAALAGSPSQNQTGLQQLGEQMKAEAAREASDKDTQEENAHKYEKSRDYYVESSFWFEISFAALQLGVILCTIASGAKHKFPWNVGLVLGVVGLLFLINGFHRVVSAPRGWYQTASEQIANDISSSPGK